MKKLSKVTIVMLLCAFSLTSCKKTWTCHCVDTAGNTEDISTILKYTKKDAKAICNNLAAGSGETCTPQ